MNIIKFERVSQLIALAAMKKQETSLISKICLQEQEITILFSDYIKSQIHLNIVSDLFGRSITHYVKALYYLRGDRSCGKEAEEVLRYFYVDMAYFLINNPYNIVLKIVVDVDMPVQHRKVSIVKIKESLLNFAGNTSDENLLEKLKLFEYVDILDEINSIEEIIRKLDSFAVAAVLKTMLPQGAKLAILEYVEEEII